MLGHVDTFNSEFPHLFYVVRDGQGRCGVDLLPEAIPRSPGSFTGLNALDAKACLLGKQLFMTFVGCLLTLET